MKLESVKTYQYVQVGNKNATSFSIKDVHGPFEITLTGLPCSGASAVQPVVEVKSRGETIFIPIVNIQFMTPIKEAVVAESTSNRTRTKAASAS